MKVWVVVSCYCYESSECIEGVYLKQDQAEEKVKEFKNDHTHYAYVEECEVIE